jgi:uncharacterized protein YndB with AHSA1/START domain
MRFLAALCVFLSAAAPALALDLPARADAVLQKGRPFVDVRPDADGSSGQILAAIDIAAPLDAVWATVTDCALAPRMAPNLKSCRVVERDPAGRWEVREQISKGGFIPPIRSVFRSDYDYPRLIRFHRTDGDLSVMEGEWRFAPQPDGDVRVTYENRVAAPFHVPGPIARAVLRHDVPVALLALRREALAKSARAR